MELIIDKNTLNLVTLILFVMLIFNCATVVVIFRQSKKIVEEVSQSSSQVEEQMDMLARENKKFLSTMNDTIQKIAALCRKNDKTQLAISQLVHEIKSEVVDQNISKLKIDNALKEILKRDAD
ncbi:MAG: hypothetical protein VYC35_11810 [Pseudomonadota bacterium]|nr:hypothetical protein [Pseudomonadota bacterium]